MSMKMISAIAFITGTFISAFGQALIIRQAQENGTSIQSCLSDNGIFQTTPDSPNWETAYKAYNLRLQYVPAVITSPKNSNEVSISVQCASKYQLKVQAKGGGHSYASFSTGGQDGSLIINMENFNEVSVDQTTYIAKIGTGQRLGNVAQALFAQGKRALPHGTCPSVGIAGHSLHGGFGFASRRWGLTLDHIVGMDVVLANGQEIYADDTSNKEIFFAMRGAADSFGIATYLYFSTEAAPDHIVHYTADLSASAQDIEKAITGFEQLQRTVFESPLIVPENTFSFYIDSAGSFSISGWCMSCDLENVRNIVLPLMLNGFSFTNITVESQDWIRALTILAGSYSLTQPLGSALSLNDTFYAKSLVVLEAKPLSRTALQNFFAYIQHNKENHNWYSIIALYGGPGSAINNPPPLALSSAYSHRDSLWVFQNYGFSPSPPYNESITPIVQGLNDAITTAQPDAKFSSYLNYVDSEYSPTEAATQYYGQSIYNRLLQIKNTVDPGFVFWNPQAIGLAQALTS